MSNYLKYNDKKKQILIRVPIKLVESIEKYEIVTNLVKTVQNFIGRKVHNCRRFKRILLSKLCTK